MPRTGFTAYPEQHLFFILLSGNQRSVSAGVQIAPEVMARLSPEHKAMFDKAKWLTARARQILEEATDDEVTHDDVYRHVRENLDFLERDYQDLA
jgi:hypothetical protein